MRREGQSFLERLRREQPEIAARADQMIADHQRLYDSFMRFFNENVRGRDPKTLASDVYAELKRRSKELRDAEQSLKDFITCDDVAGLLRQFRRDPKKFAEQRADRLIKKLREQHSDKAEIVERLFFEYNDQLAKMQALIRDKVAGKSAEQIARDALDELRTRSENLRRMEGQINDTLADLVQEKERLEKTLKSLPDRLRPIQRDAQRVKDEDLRKAEREAREWIEKRKQEAERELRRLIGGLGRR
jgi:hypothetical protein